MSQPLTDQQYSAVRGVYQAAAQMMKSGKGRNTIIQELVKQGLDEKAASTVVINLENARDDARRKRANRDIVVGGLFFVGGLLVTFLSYAAASSSRTGGSYIVAWGAVIFGGIQFFRGLASRG